MTVTNSKLLITYLSIITLFLSSCKTDITTPLERSGYTEITKYDSLMEFIKEVDNHSKHISMEIIGKSAEGRDIAALKVSQRVFGSDTSKIIVMIFAQLHGNEQSGKEGALLLLKEIANGNYDEKLNAMDIIVVPQVNPDGSELNQRRNVQDLDLNRDHLLLEAPENRALHTLFNKYLPEVTIDIHEYYPYGNDWKRYGYRKDFDIQIGLVTNPNISDEIIEYQNNVMLPFMKEYIESKGYSYHNYLVGGIPDRSVTRHSTVNINDGRQSLGILNTFSMIFEGINGRDRYSDNIDKRARCQFETMIGMLEFVTKNRSEIKKIVDDGRRKLINAKEGERVAVQTDYIKDEEPLHMPLKSVETGHDTIVVVNDYYPLVEVLKEVERPAAYLIPESDAKLMEFLERNRVVYTREFSTDGFKIVRYINADRLYELEREELDALPGGEKYLFIPVSQLQSNRLVLALEPLSEIGLVTNDSFKHLIQQGMYPVLRLEAK